MATELGKLNFDSQELVVVEIGILVLSDRRLLCLSLAILLRAEGVPHIRRGPDWHFAHGTTGLIRHTFL